MIENRIYTLNNCKNIKSLQIYCENDSNELLKMSLYVFVKKYFAQKKKTFIQETRVENN